MYLTERNILTGWKAMVSLSGPLKDTAFFEPFFMDIFANEINEQHARILSLLYKLGGYTTLNNLTNQLGIAQSTLSLRVEELVKKGFIRKNSELMPMVLVLLLNTNDLSIQLEKIINSQRVAGQFLKKVSELEDMNRVSEIFFRAIQTLYPNQYTISSMISFVYLHQTITRNDLYNHLSTNGNIGKIPSKIPGQFSSKDYDTLLLTYSDVFHILHNKQRKSETYVQPRLPLDLFVDNRLSYLESLHKYYKELLEKLKSFLTEDYSTITPYQHLNYQSEIKQRIDTCLKNYSTIRIIDNSIYQKKYGTTILELLTKSEQFGSTNKKGIQEQKHKIFILSSNDIILPKSIESVQVQYRRLKDNVNRDYLTRDFILFDIHGYLAFTNVPNAVPYYTISPRFTEELLNIFESNWK